MNRNRLLIKNNEDYVLTHSERTIFNTMNQLWMNRLRLTPKQIDRLIKLSQESYID